MFFFSNVDQIYYYTYGMENKTKFLKNLTFQIGLIRLLLHINN